MKRKHVLVDAYNLGLKHGTGIASYARNLISTLKSIDYRVSCLYDRKTARFFHKDIFNEIYFFDPKPPFVTEIDKVLHVVWQTIRSMGLLANPAISLRPTKINIGNHVVVDEVLETLPDADRFYSYHNLYHLSFIYYYITGMFVKIHIPDIDIAHWTCPIPIKAVGVKNIYTIHDIVPIRLPYTVIEKKELFHRLIRSLVRRSDRLATVSEFSRKDIIKTYPQAKDKLVNTYECVSFSEKVFSLNDDEIARIVKNNFNVNYKKYYLAVGAFEPKKNFGRLIDAYLAGGIEDPLVLVGPDGWRMDRLMGSYDESYHRRIRIEDNRIEIDRRVVRIGYVRFSMLVNLMRGAKVLCFPSLYEGFGLPVAEAISLGTPVLTSRTSSLPEVGGDAAVYVDPYDVYDIKEKLLWCESHPEELAKLAEAGKRQARRFSVERYAQAVEALYAF